MKNIEELEKRKEEIIAEIREIRTMRRGTINGQYLKVQRKEKEPSIRGPYHIFVRNEKGKTISARINTPEELEVVQKDIEAYKKYIKLSKELAVVIEAITDIIRDGNIILSKKNKKCTKQNIIVK